jgi:phosphotransferase system HPr-like phosphotransfer protein
MRFEFDIDLKSGRYAVDAKSIMGIFSLDLSKPIELIAHTEDAEKLFEAIDAYIVK